MGREGLAIPSLARLGGHFIKTYFPRGRDEVFHVQTKDDTREFKIEAVARADTNGSTEVGRELDIHEQMGGTIPDTILFVRW